VGIDGPTAEASGTADSLAPTGGAAGDCAVTVRIPAVSPYVLRGLENMSSPDGLSAQALLIASSVDLVLYDSGGQQVDSWSLPIVDPAYEPTDTLETTLSIAPGTGYTLEAQVYNAAYDSLNPVVSGVSAPFDIVDGTNTDVYFPCTPTTPVTLSLGGQNSVSGPPTSPDFSSLGTEGWFEFVAQEDTATVWAQGDAADGYDTYAYVAVFDDNGEPIGYARSPGMDTGTPDLYTALSFPTNLNQTYYVGVIPATLTSETHGYLDVGYSAGPVDVDEPNNHPSDVTTSLAAGTAASGIAMDIDIYRIDYSSAGGGSIDLDLLYLNESESVFELYVSVYDPASGSTVWDGLISPMSSMGANVDFSGYGDGMYYIVLEPYETPGAEYELTWSYWSAPTAASTLPTDGTWNTDSVATNGEVWYEFAPTSGQTYQISWQDAAEQDGASSYTGDILVSAYDSGGARYFSDRDSGFFSGPVVSVTPGDSVVYLRVTPLDSASAGDYAMRVTPVTDEDSEPNDHHGAASLLPASTSVTGYSWNEDYYKIYFDGSTDGIEVSLQIVSSVGGGFLPVDINNAATNFIEVGEASTVAPNLTFFMHLSAQAGDYYLFVPPGFPIQNLLGAEYILSWAPADLVLPTSGGYTTISADGSWNVGTLPQNGDVWYAFVPTPGATHTVRWNDWDGNGDYTADIRISAYGSDGNPYFQYDDIGYYEPRSFIADTDETMVYLRVTGLNTGNAGTFALTVY
jgi:hypothetical protein